MYATLKYVKNSDNLTARRPERTVTAGAARTDT
jgi:hypothetical protein